ncbi:MAG: diguanylate cyclase [Longimicrobiales bacterium]
MRQTVRGAMPARARTAVLGVMALLLLALLPTLPRAALAPAGALLALAVVALVAWQRRDGDAEAVAAGDPGAGGEPLPRSHRSEITELLDQLRERTGATRIVLWSIDPERERAYAFAVSGAEAPPWLPLAATPLFWAWQESMALRLDRVPGWALDHAQVLALPVDSEAYQPGLLTLELIDRLPPELDGLAGDAVLLRSVLHAQRRELQALTDRDRYQRLMHMLGTLVSELDAEDGSFAPRFAEAAIQLLSATGATIAHWEDKAAQGVVLATAGGDGGPPTGTVFGAEDCELGRVARTEMFLLIESIARPLQSPLAAASERWIAWPRALVAVPLTKQKEGVVGVLAVWSSEMAQFEPEALAALRSIVPFVGLHLHQTLETDNLRRNALRDALTGLHNREGFEHHFKRELSSFDRYARPFALLILDLDHFKQVNDQLGHEAGDEVLRHVGRAIADAVRESDVAARYGGEEFVVLMRETHAAQAADAAERLRRTIERLVIEWQGRVIPIRASLGVAACPESVDSPKRLFATADAALYASKASGRNRITVAPPVTVDV